MEITPNYYVSKHEKSKINLIRQSIPSPTYSNFQGPDNIEAQDDTLSNAGDTVDLYFVPPRDDEYILVMRYSYPFGDNANVRYTNCNDLVIDRIINWGLN